MSTQHQQSVEAFADRLVDMMNSASVMQMISIGHRTGLFDTLGRLPPCTSEEIADAAGLQERYVREWLGAMVTGRVVTYEADSGRYHLPAEHAACLTRAATPNNLAVMAQYFPVMAAVEDRIIDCFRNGGGVPYEAYGRFHDVMAEDSGQTVLPVLEDAILPLVPGLVARLEEGIEVLDVGCGSGRAIVRMARRFPRSRFAGYDLSSEAIERATAEADRENLKNVTFEVKDLTDFDVDGTFDLVTAFDAIHDQARPDQVLAGIARVLNDDGVFLMQDIGGSSHVETNLSHPVGPLVYTLSCMHCMAVSLAQGGMGLGAMWGEEKAREMLAEAGFTDVRVERLEHDPVNVYFVATASDTARRLGDRREEEAKEMRAA